MNLRRITAVFIAFVVAAEMAAPAGVFAKSVNTDGARSYKTTGKYYFSTSFVQMEADSVLEDTFVFDEECFRVSSFDGCPHLRTLSSQVANASTPYYGKRPDKYCRDMSNASKNIEYMLNAMGFSDIRINGYYNKECMENSMGFAVARRTLDVKGRKYTLIGLFPRSDGYKEEWAGNFNVGPGNIHQGFKDDRDEGLRFLKKYIDDNGIKGDLKIWVSGHSRGAAVSNMLGGFLAGGGAVYLGNEVSVDPEDIYCYTTGTPSTIRPGAPKSEELSVSGPRGGIYKKYDTEGDLFLYTGEGTFDNTDKCYGGIRCFAASHDLITFICPEKWGFTLYGKKCNVDGTGDIYRTCKASRAVSEREDMARFLKKLNPAAYDRYSDGHFSDDFRFKKLDIKNMAIIDDPDAPKDADITAFESSRIAGLIANVSDNKKYVELGYQDGMVAFGGIFGMLFYFIKQGFGATDPSMLTTVLSLYNAYAKERKATEDKYGPGAVDPTITDEAANRLLTETLDDLLMPMIKHTKSVYGEEYYNELMREMGVIKANINQFRRVISYVLFYTEDEDYSRARSLNTASTLISNAFSMVATHFKEIYISWAKAAESVTECEHNSGQAEYDEEQEEKERERREQEEKEREQREKEEKEREEREKEEKAKKSQKISVKVTGGKVRKASVKKKTVTAAALKVSNAHGKITYKKLSGSGKLTVNKSGKISVKRGTSKGKYKIKVRVSAAGDKNYKAGRTSVSIMIKVV